MSETNGSELRKIAWSQAFPFVRVFQTFRLALGFNRLVLALACVLCLYLSGRILDAIWGERNGVVAMPKDEGVINEIQVYASSTHSEFVKWLRGAREAHEQRAIAALLTANVAANADEARRLLKTTALDKLLLDMAFQNETGRLNEMVTRQLKAGLEAIDRNPNLSPADRQQRREELIGAADTVRRMLAGRQPRVPGRAAAGAKAVETIAAADPQAERTAQAQMLADLTKATTRRTQLQQCEELTPRGVFISLLEYEQRCFAAAIHGVLTGRWGFAGRAFDPAPAMAGSIESALRGLCWLINQRPWYTLVFGVVNLLAVAFFGGALCRSAAVQAARDENISLREALKFARQRYTGFLLAPILPLLVLLLIAVVMLIGGLVGAIGYVGELFTGVFYPLALLGGFAAALLVLALVLGFHLMWPTIAVEGSDGFDALSRACSYVSQRIWHCGWYAFVLLAYGAVCFSIVRLVVLLTLKLAHKFTGIGLNIISSANLTGTGKLDAMWRMPAWADLTLLPGLGEARMWGTFFNGPLDGTESVATVLLMIWVYLLVGLLAAFIVSYFFCGSTQMYFLLRREVDATDYEEVFYEEPEEELPAPSAAASGPAPVSEPGTTESTPAPGADAPSQPTEKPDAGPETS